jgi:hypothetical protein
LLYDDTRRASRFGKWGSDSWQQTPWGRLLVGLLLAQGLYYVLRHLCTAWWMVARDETVINVWATLTGLMVLQGLQAVSVFTAGLLTGAGQRRGFFFGAVMGVWNGVLCILAQNWMGQQVVSISLFGEPMLQAAFGAVGGLAGSLIWKPLPPLTLPSQLRKVQPLVPIKRRPSSFAGPLAWGRILTGVTLAVGGAVWTDVIREFVLDASEGKLKVDTQLQAELVTWEISALAFLAGGALAGASTANGMKQGLAAGVGSGSILVGIRLANHFTPQLLGLTVLSALALCLVGGWFGGELLPPVLAGPRRRSIIASVP